MKISALRSFIVIFILTICSVNLSFGQAKDSKKVVLKTGYSIYPTSTKTDIDEIVKINEELKKLL